MVIESLPLDRPSRVRILAWGLHTVWSVWQQIALYYCINIQLEKKLFKVFLFVVAFLSVLREPVPVEPKLFCGDERICYPTLCIYFTSASVEDASLNTKQSFNVV